MNAGEISKINEGIIKKDKESRKTGYYILDKRGNKLAFGVGNPLKYGFEFIVYDDRSLEKELFKITQDDILEGKYNFKIVDEINGECVGNILREKKSSFSKDLWKIEDSEENSIGMVEEKSKYKAVVREFIIGTLPIDYQILNEDGMIGNIKQKFSINNSIYSFKLNKNNMDSRFLLAIIFCVDNL